MEEKSQIADEGGNVFRPYVKSEDEIKREQENFEKGKKAEEAFKIFLNSKNIPFYYIDQSKETFSKEFYEKNIKRPDYIVYTEEGVFHVDVKYRTKYSLISNNEKRFPLEQEDIEKLYNFYKILRTDTWVAFTDEKISKFFYAPISKIYDYYIYISNKIKEKYFKEDWYEEFSWIFRECCPIHFPESLLYNQLSFQKGFYKEPDLDFLEIDVEDHVSKTMKLLKIKFKYK